ncbi:AAA family ATPase [Streptomyces sp. NPDC049916]|uniref:AAA family ATPase n=1 Tax=Streptomyces sp. NPDC049916 TaxID=3155156 RepID=UPI00343BE84D
MTSAVPDHTPAPAPAAEGRRQLFGRHEETAALDELLSRARGGTGGGLVLWGEPGIGKSALLSYVREQAADFLPLTHTAVRSESDLGHAGLHGLLRPVAGRAGSLAAPHSAALCAALAGSDEPTDRLAVGSSALSLLCGLAERQPVLLMLDDAQWLDAPTASALGFVARRVREHPVVIVIADHSDPAARPWEGIGQLRVRELTDVSARRLLASAAPWAEEATLRAMTGEAAGNPLALHETASLRRDASGEISSGVNGDTTTGVGDGGEADRYGTHEGPPRVGPRLRRAFRSGIEALSASARLLTVLTAAEEHGSRDTVRRAGYASGADDAAWEEVTDAGLVRADGDRVGFRHPLVRRAVYEGCRAAVRERAHRALAATLPETAEERAWHLAAVTHDPDDGVATLLERSAVRFRLRGDTEAAARALLRAADLSVTPVAAAHRRAAAARAAWDSGWATTAQRLLDDAEQRAPGADTASYSRGLRGVVEFARGTPEQAHRYLTADMGRVPDPATSERLGTLAAHAAWCAGRADLAAGELELLVARAPETRTEPPGPSARRNGVAPGDGGAADEAEAGDALAWTRTTAAPSLPPVALGLAWGIEKRMRDALRSHLPHLRQGYGRAQPGLAVALAQTATLDIVAGRWAEAESSAAEGLRLAEAMGADHVASSGRNGLGWLAALRGEQDTVAELTAETLETSLPRGVRALSAAAQWNRGMSSLFADRADEALATLLCLSEPGHGARHPTFALLAALDTAEAAVQTGRRDLVEAQANALEAWARRTGAPWARASAQLARALLGDADPETSFRGALDVPGARSHPLLHARAQLLYGEWLRRDRRRLDARLHLDGAITSFARLGADPLRRRAQRERELTGPPGRPAGRRAHQIRPLTSQERRVAQLAAGHLTNREIALRLRISPRTVGHHLRNVFGKLGINSRTELSGTHPGH